MRQISRRMEMIHPTIESQKRTRLVDISDLHHVFARKQCILCPALRHSCLTLLHVTSFRDFFYPGTIAHSSIRLPPRIFARLLVGNYG